MDVSKWFIAITDCIDVVMLLKVILASSAQGSSKILLWAGTISVFHSVKTFAPPKHGAKIVTFKFSVCS